MRKLHNHLFIIRVLIGGLFGYILAWGIGGEKSFPGRERREEDERRKS